MPQKTLEKREPGRPPLAENKRKRRFLTMRFDDDEFEAMEQKAGKSTIRTWARTILLRESKK